LPKVEHKLVSAFCAAWSPSPWGSAKTAKTDQLPPKIGEHRETLNAIQIM